MPLACRRGASICRIDASGCGNRPVRRSSANSRNPLTWRTAAPITGSSAMRSACALPASSSSNARRCPANCCTANAMTRTSSGTATAPSSNA